MKRQEMKNGKTRQRCQKMDEQHKRGDSPTDCSQARGDQNAAVIAAAGAATSRAVSDAAALAGLRGHYSYCQSC